MYKSMNPNKHAVTVKPQRPASHVDLVTFCEREVEDGRVTAGLCAVATACRHDRNYATSTDALEAGSVRHSSVAVYLV